MSSPRAAGREHIPKYPPGIVALPSVQLFITLVAIGLSAYSVSFGVFAGGGLLLFTGIVTLIILIWEITALSCAPRAYNYWAFLSLTVWLFILWLCSFALNAAEAALAFTDGSYYCDYSYYDDSSSCYTTHLHGAAFNRATIVAAASGVGALNFLLFFTMLVLHSVVLCRHRRAGLHSRPVVGGMGVAPQQQQPYQMHPMPHPASYHPMGPQQQQQQGQMYYGPAQHQQQGMVPMGYPPAGGYYGVAELEKGAVASQSVSPASGIPQQHQQQPISPPPVAHSPYQLPVHYGDQGTPVQQAGPYQPPQQQQGMPLQGQPYQGQPHQPTPSSG